MNSMRHEPSMDDILSTIRRVMAREEARGETRADDRAEQRNAGGADFDEFVDEPLPTERPARASGPALSVADIPWDQPAAEVASPAPAPAPISSPIADADDVLELGPASLAVTDSAGQAAPLVSDLGAAATRHALAALDAAVRPATPPPPAGATIATGIAIETLVLEALRPMLRDWLDAHLPAMVETMVAREIARITGANASGGGAPLA